MNPTSDNQVWKLVVVQLMASLAAASALIFVSWVHAWSGLIGGLIATTASSFFAMRIFVRYRAQEPGKLLGRFYGAELQKLVLTGVLFAAAIIWVKPLSAGALFGVFLLVQMTPILVAHKLD